MISKESLDELTDFLDYELDVCGCLRLDKKFLAVFLSSARFTPISLEIASENAFVAAIFALGISLECGYPRRSRNLGATT